MIDMTIHKERTKNFMNTEIANVSLKNNKGQRYGSMKEPK